MINFLVSTSVLILLVIAVRFCCHRHISMRLQYALWLLVAVKLLIFPVPWMESAVSILPVSGASVFGADTDELGTDSELSRTANLVLGSLVSQSDDKVQGTNTNQGSDYSVSDKEASASSVAESESVKKSDFENAQKNFNMIYGIALLGSGAFAVVWIIYNLRFRRYLRKHRKPFPCELAFGKKLPVYVVDHLPSPCLYGKAIYATEECVEDEGKLRHVLAHEYSHERQKDRLWSVVRGLCLACYWWHPLVWLAVHLSRQDCELACDEAAIGLLGDEERLEYGKTLLGLIQVKSTPKDYLSIATTMTSGTKSLKQRISMIAKKQRIFLSVCVVAVLAVVLGTVSTCTVPKHENALVEPTETEWNDATEEVRETSAAEEIRQEDVTEDEGADGDAEEGNLTGERLQKFVEGDMWEKSVTAALYLYNIDIDHKEVTAWAFAPQDMVTDDFVTYIDEKQDGTIVSKNLSFSEACQYFVCKEVGKTETVSVGFDDFSRYILERRKTIADYSRDGAVMCQCNIVKGKITRVEMLNPYPDIVNLTFVGEDHSIYEANKNLDGLKLQETCEAFLNHDYDGSEENEKDKIEVYTGDVGYGDCGFVLIYSDDQADEPYSIEASIPRVGWKNIYLVPIGEKDYIFELYLEGRESFGVCHYYVYEFGNQVGPNLAAHVVDAAEFTFSGGTMNEESYNRWTKKMEYYLKDAQLLLSTQDGTLRVGPANDYARYRGDKLRDYLLGQ